MSQSPQPRRPDTDDQEDETEDGDGGGTAAFEANPFEPPAGRRWTSKVEILLIEAELLQDGVTIENPAMPINQHVKERALNHLGDRRAPWRHIEKFPRSDV